MKYVTRTVVLSCVTAAAMGGWGVALAQAGGNGNGGLGSGNAHGAATAGMTYQGDPVSGPTSPWPDDRANRLGKEADQRSMSPDKGTQPAQSRW
jgi:hypothetical protein